eukprot:3551516-Pleurochrysis_carterae.AAC.1
MGCKLIHPDSTTLRSEAGRLACYLLRLAVITNEDSAAGRRNLRAPWRPFGSRKCQPASTLLPV